MAMVVATLAAKVTAEGVSETERQLESVGKKAEETKGHFEGLKNALSTAAGFAIFGGLTAGFGFLKDQISDVINVTTQHQQVMQQTAQAIRSTGDASGMTAQNIQDMADAMAHATMFSADATQQGENLLLTFTNIGQNVFPLATNAMIDMSQAMGQDLKSSAIQLGKALNDPLTGMTALQRIGVTMDDQEKKQIKTMMAHNDLIGAQGIILQELTKEFGGSAEAAGQTFGGQLAILGHQFEDIKIKIGSALLPVLSDLLNKYIVPLATKFADWMTKGGGLQDFQVWLKNAVNIFENQFLPDLNKLLNTYIIPLATALYNTGVQLANFVGWLQKGGPAADAVKVGLAGIGTVIAGFKLAGFLNDVSKGFSNMVTNINNAKNTAGEFLNWFQNTFFPGMNDSSSKAANAVASIGTAAEGDVAAENDAAAGVKSLGGASSIAAGPLALLVGSLVGLGLVIQADYQTYEANVKAGYNTPSSGTQSGVYSTVGRNPNSPNYGDYTGRGVNYQGKHASGILNNPVGHWAMVGERGPELMYVPQGSSILPNGMMPSSGGGSPVVVQLSINGYQFAQAMMPDFVTAVRGGAGRLGI